MRFRKGLGPFLVASLVLHAALSVLYVRAVSGARVPFPRTPVYRVSLVELPRPEPEPVPEPPKEERVQPEVKSVQPIKPEKVPEKPRPRKETKEEKPKPKEEAKPPAEEQRVQTKPASGGPVTVEAEDFLFSYYLALIENRVGGRWNPPRGMVTGGRKPVATVRFEILRDGHVRDARIQESSGIDFFDGAALRAVLDADPFPALPEGFTGDRLGVNFVFRLEE
ncbi:MAG: TonB C-terminal domain-containing protein [Candidatus Eisenbacteria bacterium]|nr:TonB C-terminal domain-containing protein [Candidatus Eisenbacteria bacterium]